MIHAHPPNRFAQKPRNQSPMAGSKLKSSAINSIFTSPPKPSPPPKQYPGKLLPPNPSL